MDNVFWTTEIHKNIPITKDMEISISKLSTTYIEVKAPILPNINIHQTGFAGSIYSVGITSGWVLLSALIKKYNLNALVVAENANIRYKRPITKEIVAFLTLPENIHLHWKGALLKCHSVKQTTEIQILENSKLCAEITATFYIKKQ